MNIKELLQKLASQELTADEVETQINDYVDESKGDMIPRKRLNDKNEEIKDLQEQLTERDNQIETLKSSVDNDSGLQQQIEALQKENGDWSEKYSKSQLNNAIKLAVAKDAIDPDEVLALLDKEGLELDGDSVKGLDDKLTAFREKKPHLFGQVKKTGRTPGEGQTPPAMTKDQVMGIKDSSERIKAIQDNPQLFN